MTIDKSRKTLHELEQEDQHAEDLKIEREWHIHKNSPDPYGEFGIPIWHTPLRKSSDSVEVTGPPPETVTEKWNVPKYALHHHVHDAVVGLLAMRTSVAVEKHLPDIRPGYSYITPEGVIINMVALEGMAVSYSRMTINHPDGMGSETSKIFELTVEGKRIADRLWSLAFLFDGGEPHELQITDN